MTEFDAKSFLKTLPSRPGVYRMFDEAGQALYVGKAKNLKNRVSSYFRTTALDSKTMALVARIADIQTTVTTSETEALLLEQSLIKEFRPPYNIVFRMTNPTRTSTCRVKTNIPGWPFIAAPRRRKDAISARSLLPTVSGIRLTSCRRFSRFGNARIRFFVIAPVHACSTRSSAVRVPVVTW